MKVSALRGKSGVFDAGQAQTLLDSDRDHWWFQSKATFVRGVLEDHGRRQRSGWLVDLGAGAGGVTARLGWPKGATLTVDGLHELVRQARDRHGVHGIVATASTLPLSDHSAGVVTLLDVIEHVEQPDLLLREARRIIDPAGILVVTVPAHQWLWSGADELLGHVKRYNRRLLARELAAAGFRVGHCSHIFSWLVPAVWLQRRLARDAGRQLGLDTSSRPLESIARALTAMEQRVARRRSLPMGTSIVAVARPDGLG